MATKTKKMKKPRAKSRTKRAVERVFESDSTYFLKLVVVVLCGTLWLKFQQPLELGALPVTALPLGLLLGVILVKVFEKHQADRKIWYAVLLVVGIICYFVPAGIVL